MIYNKQTWKTGEIITEGKLNHIENGIATNDSAISDLNEAKTTLSENILNLQNNKANQTEVDEIQADITSINGDVTTISNAVDALQTGVQSNTENITNLQNALPNKQDKLTAGNNITIDSNNVISATTSGGSAPENMVTTNTNQTITGSKSFKSEIRAYYPFTFDCREGNARFDITYSEKTTGNIITAPLMLLDLHEFSNSIRFGVDNTDLQIIGNILDENNKKLLTQSNVTGTNNVTVTETANGIQITGLSNASIVDLLGMTNTMTIYSNVVSGTEYTLTEAEYCIIQGSASEAGYIAVDIKTSQNTWIAISGVNNPSGNYYLICNTPLFTGGEAIRIRHSNIENISVAFVKVKGGVQ